MSKLPKEFHFLTVGFIFIVFKLFIVSCSGGAADEEAAAGTKSTAPGSSSSTEVEEHSSDHDEDHDEHDDHEADEHTAEMLLLPELEAVRLDGKPLKVVATTSIIADVVAQIGGDAIELTTLIAIGQDSHSFDPAPQDSAVSQADIIFVNGWDLEEGLVHDLKKLVPVYRSCLSQPISYP